MRPLRQRAFTTIKPTEGNTLKTVIIVNGRPRVGKDSTITAMTNLLTAERVPVTAFSSIDPIRDMLASAGIDVSAKSPADRRLMAEVGDSVEKHSNYRTNACILKAIDFFEANPGRAVIFLHVREKAIIERVKVRLENHPSGGCKVLKVLVTGPRGEEVFSNHADRDVGLVGYDDTIHNDSTLDDLARACDRLLFKHRIVEQLSLLR